jgi:hypothetical protein
MMDIDLNLEAKDMDDNISHTNQVWETSNAGRHQTL